ncbi:hypothetical protein HH214_02110 [Mucilaginibacter robiniae]|uniref:Uncharacterized protein n=1 Tax=Mucilaginibacter robiniae TaxID=2728022 RepID=A0A7L5DUM1_9SPHI|nr:hypothetical protein [Mucilaginibacter robiniae]QJD94752.1 hypothetical protein HH214_02110 [Mucilaginibacter robiniae]
MKINRMMDISAIETQLIGSWKNKYGDTIWQFKRDRDNAACTLLVIHQNAAKIYAFELLYSPVHKKPVLRTQEHGDFVVFKVDDKSLWLIYNQMAYIFEKTVVWSF